MENTKFDSEIQTLSKFVHMYCQGNKHKNRFSREVELDYKNKSYFYKLDLCEDCYKTITYSFVKLQKCPHEIKPRCRHCSKPCYNTLKWNELSSIMRYSGIRLGLTKIKNKVRNFFSS